MEHRGIGSRDFLNGKPKVDIMKEIPFEKNIDEEGN